MRSWVSHTNFFWQLLLTKHGGLLHFDVAPSVSCCSKLATMSSCETTLKLCTNCVRFFRCVLSALFVYGVRACVQ
jgi:hypothetical protein